MPQGRIAYPTTSYEISDCFQGRIRLILTQSLCHSETNIDQFFPANRIRHILSDQSHEQNQNKYPCIIEG